MGLIKGIHHVSMKCCKPEEYERTIGFYRDTLGLKVARQWNAGIMFETGSGIVEIFNNAESQLDTGTVRHFAFAVDDADACAKAVADAGYEVFDGPRDVVIPSEPGFPARIAFCYGPIGEKIEFFQERHPFRAQTAGEHPAK